MIVFMTAIKFSNQQVANTFNLIADLLEIKGENIYKILAYRKVVDSLSEMSYEIYDVWQEGNLTSVPGVGKAIAEKIDELFTTGRLDFLEKLEAEVPPSLVELLKIPDIGPKKVSLFWRELGITNLSELDTAAKSGQLRDLPGMGIKSEAKVLAGLEALARRTDKIPLGKALPFAYELVKYLNTIPGVEKLDLAGSLRRMKATVGDLDLVVAIPDSSEIMDFFTSHPQVINVIGKGLVKSSVEFDNNIRAQLWAHPVDRFGTALQYATGSKNHNVRLRELALKQGLSLSDQSFLRQDGSELLCAIEEQVYSTLGLPFIPPELREDRGEVQAALEGKLPVLISREDFKSELHTHTTWSDGKLSIKEMALEAINRGLELLAITDHSVSLGIAGGLSIEDLVAQRREIEQVSNELEGRIRIIQGCEVEIRADGSLDYPDEVLARLDIVIASLHSGLRQPREQVTARLMNAIRNPHVDTIAHPTGRMIPSREGADLDMSVIMKAALENNVALEINSHPARLDLDDVHARKAIEMGILLTINTDAHSASDLDLINFGIATARRGWVEPEHVINTWSSDRLISWLETRK